MLTGGENSVMILSDKAMVSEENLTIENMAIIWPYLIKITSDPII